MPRAGASRATIARPSAEEHDGERRHHVVTQARRRLPEHPRERQRRQQREHPRRPDVWRRSVGEYQGGNGLARRPSARTGVTVCGRSVCEDRFATRNPIKTPKIRGASGPNITRRRAAAAWLPSAPSFRSERRESARRVRFRPSSSRSARQLEVRLDTRRPIQDHRVPRAQDGRSRAPTSSAGAVAKARASTGICGSSSPSSAQSGHDFPVAHEIGRGRARVNHIRVALHDELALPRPPP